MSETERLQRYKEKRSDLEWAEDVDADLFERIRALLNHPKIDKYCMVDAYYYDFSVIPREIQDKLDLVRDAYLIFGITTEGDMITKWVDRWDLDSNDPIKDGICIHAPYEENKDHSVPIEIKQSFNPDLLSTPAPDFMKMYFGKPNG